MPVKPGQHYEMGGIETDENGRDLHLRPLRRRASAPACPSTGRTASAGTRSPNSSSSVPRAGRHAAGKDLGEAAKIQTGTTRRHRDPAKSIRPSNPVAVAPTTTRGGGRRRRDARRPDRETVEAALEAERNRVETLLEKDDGIQHAELRAELQKAMTANVNVFRNEDGLKQALRDIREVREEYQDVYVNDPSRTFNTDLIHTIETRNLIDLAEAITLGAFARDEFRGAHWRQENQNRRDDVLAQTHAPLVERRHAETLVQADHPRRREQDVRAERTQLLEPHLFCGRKPNPVSNGTGFGLPSWKNWTKSIPPSFCRTTRPTSRSAPFSR